MTSYVDTVNRFVKSKRAPLWIEAFEIWAYNPSPKTAGFGRGQITTDIRDNLYQRYAHDEVDALLSSLEPKLIEIGGKARRENLQKAVLSSCIEHGLPLMRVGLERAMCESPALVEAIAILAEYTSKVGLADSDTLDSLELPYLYSQDRRAIGDMLRKRRLDGSGVAFESLLEKGLLYKIRWVKRDRTTEVLYPLSMQLAEQVCRLISVDDMHSWKDSEEDIGVRDLVKFNAHDIPFIDGLSLWAANPTSRSAGYALAENTPLLQRNMALRYPEVDAEGLTKRLVTAIEDLLRVYEKNDWSRSEAIDDIRTSLLEEIYSYHLFSLGQDVRVRILNGGQAALNLVRVLRNVLDRHRMLEYRPEPVLPMFDWNVQFQLADEVFSMYRRQYGEDPPGNDLLISMGLIGQLHYRSTKGAKSETVLVMQHHVPFAVSITDIPREGTAQPPTEEPEGSSIEKMLQSAQGNNGFVHALSGWCLNITGKKVGYGEKENRPLLFASLVARFGEAEAQSLMTELDMVLEEIRKELRRTGTPETDLVEATRERVSRWVTSEILERFLPLMQDRVKREPDEVRRAVVAFALTLLKQNPERSYIFLESDDLSRMHRLAFGMPVASETIRDTLLKLGVVVRTAWVTGSGKSNDLLSLYPWADTIVRKYEEYLEPRKLIYVAPDLKETVRASRSWPVSQMLLVDRLLTKQTGDPVDQKELSVIESQTGSRQFFEIPGLIILDGGCFFLNPLFSSDFRDMWDEHRKASIEWITASLNDTFEKIRAVYEPSASFGKLQYSPLAGCFKGYFASRSSGAAQIVVTNWPNQGLIQSLLSAETLLIITDLAFKQTADNNPDYLSAIGIPAESVSLVVYDGHESSVLRAHLPFVESLIAVLQGRPKKLPRPEPVKNDWDIDCTFVAEHVRKNVEEVLIELKSQINIDTDHDKAEFIKDMMAMANMCLLEQQRGLILVGPKPGGYTGQVQFLDDAKYQDIVNQRLRQKITFLFKPIVCDGVTYGVFIIQPLGSAPFITKKWTGSDNQIFLKDGECWLREGTKKCFLNQEEFAKLAQDIQRKLAR